MVALELVVHTVALFSHNPHPPKVNYGLGARTPANEIIFALYLDNMNTNHYYSIDCLSTMDVVFHYNIIHMLRCTSLC